jgi:lipopolysaccharide transport system permease protein
MEPQTPTYETVEHMPVVVEEQWTTVIRPRNEWFYCNLKELWAYRDLVLLFVRRDFVAQYKQTILGPLWFFLTPLFTTGVMTIVFGKIAQIPTDGIPSFLFYLSGTVCWGYFSGCFTETSNTFVANAHILGKVYFPRLVIPISGVISQIFKFLIQFGLFLGFLLYFYMKGSSLSGSVAVFALPLLALQMGLLSLGCGIIVSSMTTKYRDLTIVVGFGIQLWMYATPVVYPLSQIPEHFRNYFAINPMVGVIETFRLAFLGVSVIALPQIAISWIVTLLLLVTGLVLFTKVERTFMDTV